MLLVADSVADGVLLGDHNGAVLGAVTDGDGEWVGFGGLVGCGFVGREVEEELGAGRLELVDVALEPDEGLVRAEDVTGGIGDRPGGLDGGTVAVDDGSGRLVLPGADGAGAVCRAHVARSTAPGSTRGSADGSELDDIPIPVLGMTAPGAVAACDVGAVADTDPVLTAAAPEPKSALRCTKPMCATTWARPGNPLTAAATPDTESVPTVMAAITPTRARVRRRA